MTAAVLPFAGPRQQRAGAICRTTLILILRSSLPSIPRLARIVGSGPEAFPAREGVELWLKFADGTNGTILKTNTRRKEDRGKDLSNLGHLVALISQLKGEAREVTHFCPCEVCRHSR